MTEYKRNIYTAEDGSRVADAINALDYPALPLSDDLWVIWTHSGRWPDADRVLRYLSKTKTDAVRGFALLTTNHRDAKRFGTEAEALAWLDEQNAMRLHGPWVLNVTTVETLKVEHGFYVEDSP